MERGFQLWPAASYAEYRLALDAPGEWAGAVLVEGAGRFALGPLPEVAASTHTWDELAPHVPGGPPAALAAHERVVRGEELWGRFGDVADVFELPLALQDWEPRYALAEYQADEAHFPTPPRPTGLPTLLGPPAERVDNPVVTSALVDLARTWAVESDGRVEAVAVEGGAHGAIAALGLRSARTVEIDADEALAHLAWTAASGGAHGRRRGAATGRARAWWALACLADLDLDWPVHPDDLGEAAAELTWLWWDAAEPETGWSLRLAVADEAHGLAWALAAVDAA